MGAFDCERVFLLGGAFTTIFLLAAFFTHSRALGAAGIIALAAAMLAQAMTEGWCAYVLLKSERWKTLKGKRMSRSEQPVRFKIWLTSHVLAGGVYAAVAFSLVYIGSGLWFR